ncbi:sugar ABC transporter permease [Streptomyces sp. NBC_01799]|uniref:multiple monosaccharide ABC transporter permease n=1 Tax=Streptomyces sp. NBC_01800 TaxID=2975945 RepID=UPI002DDC0D1F|nr:multiple monosaccharide ABC transporter permease [Streptomyces sp. NBC_01800]WSA72842.1 sugar ABC transporter permease [Streptomyces sp. NBC_01800]WSA81369.1 sugar ABC transporter permease [Streptomyces sp. NBC_01799]
MSQAPTETPQRPTPVTAAVPATTGTLLLDAARRNMRQYGMLIALGLIVVLFEIWTDGVLLKPNNVTNLVLQNSYILVLAIGMMIVIIAGHIDLSVGSLAAFVSAACAVMMVEQDVPWVLALVLALVVGAVAGAWQGFWIAYVGIPSFIVTLAGMLLFRGGTQILLGSRSLGPFPEGFQKISTGYLPEVGPQTNYHNLTLLMGLGLLAFALIQEVRDRRRQQRYGLDVLPRNLFLAKCVAMGAAVLAFTMTLASYRGVPVVLLLLAVLLMGFGYVMRNAIVGRHVYALGGNRAAAKLSGVKDQRVTFLVFVNMGVLAALAGIVYAARLNAGVPQAGTNFELEAIAAAFIGGASMSGGVGTVFGAIIGGLVLGVLNNGMSLVGIGTDYQQVIKGFVLLAAVGFDVYNKRKAGS